MAFGAILGALPAIGGIASGIGSLFGKKDKKKSVSQQPMMPGFQLETGENLAKWINQYLQQYKPGEAYGGTFTAGPTGQEQTSLQILDQILKGSATGDTFAAGKQQIMDTLSGKFADPSKSQYIQSSQTMAERNLQDAIDAARRSAGSRGTYFTTASLGEERELQTRTQDYLNNIIGQFMETERGRQFAAAPIAQEMDKYEKLAAPLAQVQAGQTYGSLLRDIEQGDLERKYQDFTRQRGELSALPGQAQSMYSGQPSYGIKNWETAGQSTLDRIVGAVGTAGSMGTSIRDLLDIFKKK
jgi:hypothetical protein